MMNDWVENEQCSAHPLRFLVVESSLGIRILIRMHLLELKHLVDMAGDDDSARELAFMRGACGRTPKSVSSELSPFLNLLNPAKFQK
ncbi:hypothetical protein [Legionella pneumophila]|uniref:hypothetical protein n=1 Tax=Legionella pneumophila TaxID=446 RepID=UPI002244986F|nr:hypothetical protein [Legionella pneumophila]MCW8394056.1 hypothetical protein [Legionella pneumophila]